MGIHVVLLALSKMSCGWPAIVAVAANAPREAGLGEIIEFDLTGQAPPSSRSNVSCSQISLKHSAYGTVIQLESLYEKRGRGL